MVALFRTISDSQNFNFCNFSGHFSCLSGQGEILTFSPWIEILRPTKYPTKSPVFSRHGALPERSPTALEVPIQFLYRHPIVFTLSVDDFEKDIFIKEIVNFRHKSISLWNKISACPARKRGIPGWTVEDGLGTLFIAKILPLGENLRDGIG